MIRYLLGLSMILFISCSKEYSDDFIADVNYPGIDTTWTQAVSKDAPVNLLLDTLENKEPLEDSFDINEGGQIDFGDSLEIIFPANANNGSGGNPVTGKAEVDVIFLRKKGDFIRYQRPTTSGGYLLETGGAMDIRVKQNAMPLQLAPGNFIRIRYREVSPQVNMSVFYGDTTVTGNNGFDWTQAAPQQGSVNMIRDSAALMKGYELLSQHFRWINCDRFTDSTVEAITTSVLLPVNFTNQNSALFAVFSDQRTVVRLSEDVQHHLFTANNIPLGSKLTFISLSKIGKDFYLGTKDATITTGASVNLLPEKQTLQQINNYLDVL